jgi:tetratricopeptide (TPR) repeat protein
MFEAVYEHCGSAELLSYWLDIESKTDVKLENEYAEAWSEWDLHASDEATGDSAAILWFFLEKAGRYGNFTDRLARISVAIVSSTYGEESEQVSSRLREMAQLLQAKGSYQDSEVLARRALAIAERVLGPDHPDTAIQAGNLGSLLRIKGDHATAERLLKSALNVLERELGPEHLETANIIDSLAELFRDNGEYEKAEPLYRRALAIAEMAGYLKEGKMKSKVDVVDGLENFPETLLKLFNGENFGKLV